MDVIFLDRNDVVVFCSSREVEKESLKLLKTLRIQPELMRNHKTKFESAVGFKKPGRCKSIKIDHRKLIDLLNKTR